MFKTPSKQPRKCDVEGCTSAGERFTASGLLVHKNQMHKVFADQDRKYCPEPGCLFSSTTQGGLDSHTRNQHSVVREFFCSEPECAHKNAGLKGFKTKNMMTSHTRGVHGPKTEHCDACTMSFTTPAGLGQHKRQMGH
jgi:hypothetical protein